MSKVLRETVTKNTIFKTMSWLRDSECSRDQPRQFRTFRREILFFQKKYTLLTLTMSCNFKLIHPLKSFGILNPTHPFYFWTKILKFIFITANFPTQFLFLETLVVALCENSDVQQRTFRNYQLKGDRKVTLQKRKFTLKFKCYSAFAVFSAARYFAFHTQSPIRTSD